MLPGGIWDTIVDTWNGGDIDVTDREAIEARRRKEAEWDAYQQKYEGKAFDGVTGAMRSIPYSLTTLGASVGAGAAGTVGGFAGATAAGMAASGAVAYRATKQDFMNRLYDQTEQAFGRAPSQEEWNNIAAEFDKEATEYGLWEAGPEALSNFLMLKFLKPAFTAKSGIGAVIKGAAKTAGEELGTETITQKGQAAIDYGLGWRPDDPTWWEALKEVAPETLWQTALMGAGGKAVHSAYNRFARRKGGAQDNADETQEVTVTPALPEGQPVYALPLGQNIVMGTRETGLGPISMVSQQDVDIQSAFDPALIEHYRQQGFADGQIAEILDVDVARLQLEDEKNHYRRQGFTDEQIDELVGVPQPANQPLSSTSQRLENNDQGIDLLGEPEAQPAPRHVPAQPVANMPQPAAGIGAAFAQPENSGLIQESYGQPLGAMQGAIQPAPPVAPLPGANELTDTQIAPRADTQEQAGMLGLPVPETTPAQQRHVLQPQAAPQGQGSVIYEPMPARQGAPTAPLSPANGSHANMPAIPVPQPDVEMPEMSAEEREAMEEPQTNAPEDAAPAPNLRRTKIKIPNRPDEDVEYELAEIEDIKASHLPENGFARNPRYELENERRYHDEPASQANVLNHAQGLDAAFLLDNVDANHGAPVVDRNNNVIGGNSRVMSIDFAYEHFPDRGNDYKMALTANAKRLGFDPEAVQAMNRPVLVRKLARDMDREERQALVSAMNGQFTNSRESRADSKSRGDRLSPRTLEALAKGIEEADSLRDFFSKSESAPVVEELVGDGVIQETEKNAFVNRDGTLNPDGRRLVEQALRGRIAETQEILAALPEHTLAKLDGAIPHFLTTERIGGEWDISDHARKALELVAGYEQWRNGEARKNKPEDTYLNLTDFFHNNAPIDRYAPEAVAIFRKLLNQDKKGFVTDIKDFARQAKLSDGGLGVNLPLEQAKETFLGIKASKKKAAPASPKNTEEEIMKAANTRGVTDPDRPFQGVADFYKDLIASYLEVNGKEAQEEAAGGQERDYGTIENPDTAGQGKKPLEYWSRGALLAELGGGKEHRKASKPELVKAVRDLRQKRERKPFGKNRAGETIYIDGYGVRHLDPKNYISSQPAPEKGQNWDDADGLYRRGEDGRRFLTSEELAERESKTATPGADSFGRAYSEYSGKPEEAIEHLLKVKEGYVPAQGHSVLDKN